jgi:hypothetical protein
MTVNDRVIEEVAGLYRVSHLKIFRKTKGVTFDFVPVDILRGIDAIDRVIHEAHAISPGSVGAVERPWYMHPCQEDNLIVLSGTRFVEIYTPVHGKVESFVVTADEIRRNGELVHDGGVMLSWPRGTFHRIRSAEKGSASINLAVHFKGFDIRTNFSIYDVDLKTGGYRVIREGFNDQF